MKFRALALAVLLVLLSPPLKAQTKLSMSQLEKLVAPIALDPDPLLAQVLPASTYPLEIVDAARIIHGSGDFSKIDSQNWDPSVKAVAHYPSTLQMMNNKLTWTQTLGQAVLNQQQDVMQAIQNLRAEAQKQGNLKSTVQQKVSTDSSNKIEIVPTNTEIVYVPTYDPTLVYSTSAEAAVVPLVTFGAGMAMGAWLSTGIYWGGNTIVCCGGYWGPRGWNNVTVNNYNINNNNWQHNANRSNPTTGRTGSDNLVSSGGDSPFAKNHGGFSGGNWNQAPGSGSRQANANMFGDRGGGNRDFGGDSFRGFQSRGGGGFGRFGGGGFRR
ncbi:MAG TPA: DUF3300 domain-containing protein [bacterium]|nr:DUF3300 domain-containing protein [bacterium]